MKLLTKRQIGEIIRFGFVGGLATLIQYTIYIILLRFIGVNFSYTVGYLGSLFFNFILTNYFTFKTIPTKKKGMRFLLAHGFNYLLQMGLLNLFVNINIEPKIAPFIVYSISIPINFFLVKKALK
ncbi:GtrA family protein [Clostridium gasigenes]|nr:GtrA family protein [Clostridium gasigenes]MBB6624636.1 GtrA family protein [Clostridium gasigenes]MBU3088469.1 GtrA family protein [Clostridium gasigenes]MBU3103175.1 GtrA family protein [Clostridium gasigenes]MBU3133179.1 GtrA family protein [Clostridium gasigenes]MBU3137144.1 GtrA family protein [Clostridium gasigenes]